jgi:hypothetical protein
MKDYRYDSLPLEKPSIRVLHLLPGTDDDIIRCNLAVHSFQEANETTYEALSYFWGDPNDRLEIYIDDKVLRVTRNLYAALHRLRSGDHSRVLWVDAVCINQSNLAERASQVQMMRHIYQQAKSTLVWLGPGDVFTLCGFELIPRLIQVGNLREVNDDHRPLAHLTAGDRKTYDLPSQYHPSWRGLFGIFELPYFSRIWIIQEVAVSRSVEVFCSDSLYCTWDDLVDATAVAMSLRLDIYHNTFAARLLNHINIARGLFQLGISRPLISVVEQYRTFNATDDRDRIYALLGLCSKSSLEKFKITPNYHENNTASRVFTELALKELMNSGSLDLLSVPKAIDVPGFDLALPSWVPDWTKSPQNAPLLDIAGSTLTGSLKSLIKEQSEQEKRNYTPDFAAASSSRSSITIDKDTYYLRLDGFRVDDIIAVGAMLPEPPRSPSNHGAVTLQDVKNLVVGSFQSTIQNGKTMHNWEEITGARSGGFYKTGEPMLDAFWKTFLGGYTIRLGDEWPLERSRWEAIAEEYRVPSRLGVYSSSVAYALAIGAKMVSKMAMQAFGSYSSREWPADLQSPNAYRTHGRRMFVTRSSYIGLGPQEVQIDDKVVICSGGKVPLIFRMHGDGYQFIGDSYVHGIMNGEIYNKDRCTSLTVM